jgi:hypothetical protein
VIEIKRGETAHICCEVRLCLGEPAKADEFIRAKSVGFEDLQAFLMQSHRITINLPKVSPPRPLRGLADTVLPVIAVGEATPWPTNNRKMNLLHHGHQLRTNAVVVGDLRSLPNPYAVVNHSPNVFRKLAVDVW